jgi:pimeloyl-ACP methyl ester carboxylesterase
MNDFALPETRYALSGDVNLAYQVMGDGPVDIILVPGFISHIEFRHELPGNTAFLRRLSSFARVVTFDKRGQGLSDRVSARLRSNSEWMTFAPSWMLSARNAQRCSGIPKAAR